MSLHLCTFNQYIFPVVHRIVKKSKCILYDTILVSTTLLPVELSHFLSPHLFARFSNCHFFLIRSDVPQSGSFRQQLVQSLMRIPKPFSVQAGEQLLVQVLCSMTKTPPTLVITAYHTNKQAKN